MSSKRFSLLSVVAMVTYVTTNMAASTDIQYQELRTLLENNAVLLVDVREPKELKVTGKIPNSINIPVNDVEMSLKLPQNEFRQRYGKNPPKTNGENLVFSCRSGRRASLARDIAHGLGFTRARVYSGSFNDWMFRGGPVEEM